MLIHHDDLRLVRFRFLFVHQRIGNDDDRIAHLSLTGSCPVQADDAAAALAGNGIRLQPFPIVVIHNLHLFARQNSGSLQQIFINRYASHIIQTGLGNNRAMNFTVKHSI